MSMEIEMKSLMVAAVLATGLILGGAGLAGAAGPNGTLKLAANLGQDYNSGVGGNGAATVRQGETYGGVGGNGSAKVGQAYTSGVGGNGAATVGNGQAYGGVGGNGSATKKE